MVTFYVKMVMGHRHLEFKFSDSQIDKQTKKPKPETFLDFFGGLSIFSCLKLLFSPLIHFAGDTKL